jgi:hypothetical protein
MSHPHAHGNQAFTTSYKGCRQHQRKEAELRVRRLEATKALDALTALAATLRKISMT